MMQTAVKISKITGKTTSRKTGHDYAVCWVKNGVRSITIDQVEHKNVSNSLFFFSPKYDWTIHKKDNPKSSGYVLYLPKNLLDHQIMNNLHINEVRIFSDHEIPIINLAPGIEKRIQSILEMLDELIGSHLNHKEDAIISLLHTFFVYCDGQCNIKSALGEDSAKKAIVYKFKKLVDQWFNKYHEVGDYAGLLHISGAYLNECVNEVLGVNAKSIITEARVMRSRHQLKFTDKTVKEIGFEMGFSSPDYFSYFLKKHTGLSPTELKQC